MRRSFIAISVLLGMSFTPSAAYSAHRGESLPEMELPAQKPLNTEIALMVFNNYLWRGEYLYADGVPLFQPSITLGSNQLPMAMTLSFYTPLRRSSDFSYIRNEIDLDIYADIEITDGFTITPGIVGYFGPWADDYRNNEEIYLILSYQLDSGFGFQSSFFFDFDAMDGVYFNFGPTFSGELNSYMELETGLIFGFTKYSNLPFSMIESGLDTKLSFRLSDYFKLPVTMTYIYNGDKSRHCYALGTGIVITL